MPPSLTFGHTGFTGTCAWADPEQQLVYVFLSNRTYPSMNNYRLNKLRTRRRILSTVYEAIRTYPYISSLPMLPETDTQPTHLAEK